MTLRGAPRMQGMGDILSDAGAIAALVKAASSPGGVGGWFTTQLQALASMPTDLATLTARATLIAQVLSAAGIPTPTALATAQQDIANAQSQYPSVNANVNALAAALAPYWGNLVNGNVTTAALAAVSSSGINLVDTFDGLNTVLAQRNDAITQLNAIGADPTLPATVRSQIGAALTLTASSGTSSWVKWLLIAGGLYVAYRLAKKVL